MQDIYQQTGHRPAAVVADITTTAGRNATLIACPQPGILIYNSSGPAPGHFRDWRREPWIAALDCMMLGPIDMIRRVADDMIARQFDRIVNITSRSVKIPQREHNVSINNILPHGSTFAYRRRQLTQARFKPKSTRETHDDNANLRAG